MDTLFTKVFSSSRKAMIMGIILCSVAVVVLIIAMIITPIKENLVIAELFVIINVITIFFNLHVIIKTKRQEENLNEQ